ncbi:MAG: hypothetical protein AAGN35_14795 [Bacteroidota bacterium]
MKYPPSILIAALLTTLFLTACHRNPGWDGYNSENNTEEMAEATCACLYEVMGEMPDKFDVVLVLNHIEAFMARPDFNYEQTPAGEKKEFRDVARAFAETDAINDRLETCECMQPIDDAMFNKGLDYEELASTLEKHCKLGVFYD